MSLYKFKLVALVCLACACALPINKDESEVPVMNEINSETNTVHHASGSAGDIDLAPLQRQKRYITRTNHLCPVDHIWVRSLQQCIPSEEYKNMIDDDYYDED